MVRLNSLLAVGVLMLACSAPAFAQIREEGPAPAASDMMNMKKMMMQEEMMMMAKKAMMMDETMTMMLAREMMIQEMLRDKEFMAAVHKNMMMTPADPAMMKMMSDENLMLSKTAMMKDSKALAMIMKELMLRQMAADRMAKMMQEEAAPRQ